jgi:hypothetical protein
MPTAFIIATGVHSTRHECGIGDCEPNDAESPRVYPSSRDAIRHGWVYEDGEYICDECQVLGVSLNAGSST